MLFGGGEGEWPDRALYSQNGGAVGDAATAETVHKIPSHATCRFTMILYFILKAAEASVFFLFNSVSCRR